MTINKIADNLWLGNKDDAIQDGHRFDVVVNVAKDFQFIPKNTNYFHVGLTDGGHNELHTIRLAVDALTAALEDGRKVFIHCISGSSRSTTISAAYLALKNNTMLQKELKKIKDIRPYINPVPSLVAKVEEAVYGESQGEWVNV